MDSGLETTVVTTEHRSEADKIAGEFLAQSSGNIGRVVDFLGMPCRVSYVHEGKSRISIELDRRALAVGIAKHRKQKAADDE